MGGGSYCFSARTARSEEMGYSTKSTRELFTQREISNGMSPRGVTLRESRDSGEHPNSYPIILALDVTGSMGHIPHYLVKEGLPQLMDKVITAGVADPQVMFIGIGDHECDRAPLQVSQFESSDQLLDKWLTELFIEGGGGSNYGESYSLAWFFAGNYTATDSLEKRGKKGLLITIGDEPVLQNLQGEAQKAIMGSGQFPDLSAAELLGKAREKYEVYHLHMLEGQNGSNQRVKDGWSQLMGDHVIFVQRKEDVAQIIADLVLKQQGEVVPASMDLEIPEKSNIPNQKVRL